MWDVEVLPMSLLCHDLNPGKLSYVPVIKRMAAATSAFILLNFSGQLIKL